MTRKILSSPFFIFPLASLVFLWPVSLCLFTLKNDALTYYYPVRTLISDALHNGELPLWTPFINMGYPLHADMQSGAWNPILLLLGSLTHYSLAFFHFELLLYFSLAGTGFYLLCRSMGWSRQTGVLLGLAYQFSGFMTNSTQFFVCIIAAACLPFILLFLRRTIRLRSWKDSLGAGIFLSLLLTGSYPALFILTCYMALAFLLCSFFGAPDKKLFIRSITPLLLLTLTCFVLLSLPALLSFARHLPFIERGRQQSLDFVQQNSFPPLALISLLGPFSVSASHPLLPTDPLMRNIYMGLIPLAALILGIRRNIFRNNRRALFWLFGGIFFLMLAFGRFFFLHKAAYFSLPLFNTFRHPALCRLFALFCFLLASGYCLNHTERSNCFPLSGKWVGRFAGILFIAGILTAIFAYNTLLEIPESGEGLFASLSSLTFPQRIYLQLGWLLLLAITFYCLQGKCMRTWALPVFMMIDMFTATQISLPLTIIGSKSFTQVEQQLHRNPEPFPLPGNRSIAENSAGSFDSLHLTGSMLPFTKKIGRNDYYITPGNLSTQEKFYDSRLRDVVFNQPLFYFADTAFSGKIPEGKTQPAVFPEGKPLPVKNSFSISGASIQPTALSSNSISCNITNPQQGLLVLQQNLYPGWQASIDDKPTTIFPLNITFMGILTPPGTHRVLFRYHPDGIMATAGLSMFAWITVLVLLASGSLRRFFRKQQ